MTNIPMPGTPLTPNQNLDLITFYAAALTNATPQEQAQVAPFLAMAVGILAPAWRKLDQPPGAKAA